MAKITRISFILFFGLAGAISADEPEVDISTATRIQSDINTSTETAVFPKLLWEKKLSKPITSSAISKDGTKIAIADETGYLTLYNTKGEKLWDYRYKGKLPKRTYEFKSDKSDTALLNIQFSSSGKFIVCDLGVLNTWENLEGFEDFERYEPYKKLCFDSEGKLLWQTSRKGEHAIGGDSYVLIKPPFSPYYICGEGDCDPDVTTPSVTYYLLDMKGQVKFTGKADGDIRTTRGFSEDGKYVFVQNKIIECANGHIVWEELRGQFWEIYNTLVIYSGDVHDIVTRKELLRIKGYSNQVSLSNTHVASLGGDRGIETITVYEIKNSSLTWTYQYNIDNIPSQEKLFYLTKNGKHLLLGREKGMLFYDISGQKVGELKVTAKVAWPQYFRYSISENGEYVLIGHEKSIKLFKPF
ncbi:MAG: hypothetical protein HY746_03990 [Elusimicrobia bacterium]|nr:hypothetical protein [Elusimicrobiota bacterium]